MNPGISEEAGQTARSLIDAFRQQPMMLLLMTMMAILLVYIFYTQNRQMDTRDNNLKLLFDGQKVIFTQWQEVITAQVAANQAMHQAQVALSDKLLRCVAVEDATKMMQTMREVLSPFKLQSSPPMPSAPPDQKPLPYDLEMPK